MGRFWKWLRTVFTWFMAAPLVAGLVSVLPEAPRALAEDAGAAVEVCIGTKNYSG